jgi:hypothetical protein
VYQGDKEFTKLVNSASTITPDMKKRPGREKDEPYTLRIEYLHQLVEN